MKVYKGSIITCNEKYEVYNYLVENNGLIEYVGNNLPKQYQSFAVIDLHNKALIPTFCDNHTHFVSYAVLSMAIDIGDAESNDKIKSLFKGISEKSRKMIFAFGANNTKVKEKVFLTRQDLDSVCLGNHCALITSDGHGMIVNTKTLNALPKHIKSVRGYNPETGMLINEAFYIAVSALSRLLPKKDIIACFGDAIDKLAQKGIGSFACCVGSTVPGDFDVNLLIWAAKGQRSGIQMRIMYQTFALKKIVKRRLPRLGGCFETALDGSIAMRDAALKEPYCGTNEYGILYHKDKELFEKVSNANKAGLQVQMHAIGDAAFEQAAYAIKYALDEHPRKDHRHGIIHGSLPTAEGVKICKQYNIQILAQFAFLDLNGDNFEPMYAALGERVYQAEPYRQLWDKGIVLSAGSDAPVTEPDPIAWLNKACNNLNYKNRLTIQEVLRACTYNGYYAFFDEGKRGSLEKGKIADMLILSKNPYAIDKAELDTIRVAKVFSSAKEYKKPKGGIVSAILRGLFTRSKDNY